MSELKVHNINNTSLDVIANCDFYLKSEVDKEIAELEEKHFNDLQSAEDSFKSILELNRKELRHHKHKRCLAMAMWCRSRACFYDTMRADSSFWARKSDRAYKWHKRWLKIAEKFKEAK